MADVDDFVPKATQADAKKERGTKPARRAPTEKQIREAIDQTWVAASLYVSSVRHDEYCGIVIAERGPALTEQLLELARVNPGVKRALEAWASTGAWGGVVGATVAMAVPILAHHGRIPAEFAARFGAPLPEPGPEHDANTVNNGAGGSAVAGSPGDVGMETGRARYANRANRVRKDDAGGGHSEPSGVRSSASKQTS